MTSRSFRIPLSSAKRDTHDKARLWRSPMSHFFLPGTKYSDRVQYVQLPTIGDEDNGCKREPDCLPEECAVEKERGKGEPQRRTTANGTDEVGRVDEKDGAAVAILEEEEEARWTEEEEPPPARCAFVEQTWFQVITALIICANAATTFVAMDRPSTKKWFYYPENGMLCFYVFEIVARMAAFGKLYLCGSLRAFAWNALDIVVVAAGVIDQWIEPMTHIGGESMSKILHVMRLLRLLRILKIVRVFLDSDLSWTEKPVFQSLMGMVILANSLLMGFEMDIAWAGWTWAEHLFLVIYVFELSVRIKNFGLEFLRFRNPDLTWNILDSIIVMSSVLDSWMVPLFKIIRKSLFGLEKEHEHGGGMSLSKVMMLMRMMRLFRILRLVKLVKSVRPLFMLVTSMISAFQGVVWVLVLTIVTLYGMGIMTTSLIGHKLAFPPGHEISDDIISPFATVAESMFTLFRVMSGASSEQESLAIDAILNTLPSLKFAFVFFMITSSWTLLSILTAVVSENMITSTQHQEHELKLQSAEEDRQEHDNMLREIFEKIDTHGKGYIGRQEVECYLGNSENRIETAKSCQVPARQIQDVLCMLCDGTEDGNISLDAFLRHLTDAAEAVSELSLTKLEIRIKSLFAHFEQRMNQVEYRLLNSFHPPQQMHCNLHSPLHEDLHRRQESALDSSLQEDLHRRQQSALDESKWQTLATVFEGLPEQGILACGHHDRQHEEQRHDSKVCSDQKSTTDEDAHEKDPLDKRMRAFEEFNQQLLSTAQEAQRVQTDFLESLEQRWQLMENASHGVVRSLEELRAGLEVGFLHASLGKVCVQSSECQWTIQPSIPQPAESPKAPLSSGYFHSSDGSSNNKGSIGASAPASL